jgi:hypothetical protein
MDWQTTENVLLQAAETLRPVVKGRKLA